MQATAGVCVWVGGWVRVCMRACVCVCVWCVCVGRLGYCNLCMQAPDICLCCNCGLLLGGRYVRQSIHS